MHDQTLYLLCERARRFMRQLVERFPDQAARITSEDGYRAVAEEIGNELIPVNWDRTSPAHSYGAEQAWHELVKAAEDELRLLLRAPSAASHVPITRFQRPNPTRLERPYRPGTRVTYISSNEARVYPTDFLGTVRWFDSDADGSVRYLVEWDIGLPSYTPAADLLEA